MHCVSNEFNVAEADWQKTVLAVHIIINNSSSRRLSGRAPITMNMGMDAGNSLQVALSTLKENEVSGVNDVSLLQNLEVKKLLQELCGANPQ